MIILPRQARDKHRESTRNKACFFSGARADGRHTLAAVPRSNADGAPDLPLV
eukprot:COSAG06_NODE_4055_length_4619_cov_64.502434_3_plen_52_part_00